MCIKFIDDLWQPLFHEIAMISEKSEEDEQCMCFVLNVYIILLMYMYMYMCVM